MLGQPILPWTRRILREKMDLVKMHQVTPKECHLHAVKRIFRYLKGHPTLGLWYHKESPFDLVAYSDSDYGGATQDRKSTTGGCQFLGRRLISCAICIVKNHVYHSKTKYIEIRHYFIRDCYEKKLINVDHIHTDDNVADLLTKPFDVWRFQYLVEQQSSHHDTSSPSHLTTTTKPIPTETPTETPTLRQYSRRATQIAQSKALSPAADEPASLLRDDSQREAFPTVSSLDAGQDRENINKSPALPHESTPRVTSLNADEGKPSRDDAPVKGRSMEIKEEVGVERSTEIGSNDTEEMVNVLSSMEAANILTSGVADVSVPPVAGISTVGVPTVSRLIPTVSAIFTTASVVTPYSRHPRGISAKDKGKEKVVESEELKKKKLQEQIDAQVAREIEEEIAREDQRMNEQLAGDAKIARIHAEEELKMLIDGLDRSNEVIAKHLQEYEQSEAELTIREKIELINELEFYMSVLRSHAGWKTKHFRGMTLKEIREKFIPVWKQLEDFVPMSSTEEGKRMKRKGLKLDERSAKRMKISEDVSEEDLKEMIQLVPVKEVYVEALQVKHPIID
uniref:Uncharacterized protein n=1 Tax=Tanacetum cinerariifolium TaxID=118510 RepID=A0A699JBD7_TANCI|nr:hypothetical protein [Tanacetum cinerariifolium]